MSILLWLLEMYTFTVENEKRRKTVFVFAYVVFFMRNLCQEARVSFGASMDASTAASISASSSTGTPKVLISGNLSRNQLLMTG